LLDAGRREPLCQLPRRYGGGGCGRATSITAGALAPIVEDAAVMAGIVGDLAPVASVDESFEEWMRRMTGSVGDALLSELKRVFG
jgi:hypothetical protein